MSERMAPNVPSLLAQYGVRGEEIPLDHDGYSGARLSAIESNGRRWILKRINIADDWMMRVTRDARCREAQFAVSPVVRELPSGVSVPSVGAAHDGDGYAVLMRDVEGVLFRVADRLDPTSADLALQRLAEMHACFWERSVENAGVTWCDPRDRVAVLSPDAGRMLEGEGRDFGVSRGWQAFERLAPGAALRLTRGLFADPSPLLALLHGLPSTLLHADAKAANMGIDAAGTLWLIDWAHVSHGAVGLELGWLLSVNSSLLPWPLAETLARYGSHLEHALGASRFADARWDGQCRAAYMVGLLLYGWGKALDADNGRPDELRWWCERASAAALDLGW